MAIHDRSKDGHNEPKPNIHDIMAQRAAHGTPSVNYTTDASTADGGPNILSGISRLVKTGSIFIQNNGLTNTTTASLAHNLGYAPKLEWGVNNASIAGLVGVNLIAPPAISFNVDNASGTIIIKKLVLASSDAANINFQLFDPTLSGTGLTITYYLYQQAAA